MIRVVLPAHLTYGARADEGVEFLVQQVKGAQAKIKAKKAKREAERRDAVPLLLVHGWPGTWFEYVITSSL